MHAALHVSKGRGDDEHGVYALRACSRVTVLLPHPSQVLHWSLRCASSCAQGISHSSSNGPVAVIPLRPFFPARCSAGYNPEGATFFITGSQSNTSVTILGDGQMVVG